MIGLTHVVEHPVILAAVSEILLNMASSAEPNLPVIASHAFDRPSIWERTDIIIFGDEEPGVPRT